ncbi:MAG: YbbR-like domain-containing protein [Anaerolineaceae bacterium]
MTQLFKKFTKNLPTFLTALALAITIWIMAVNATDPVDKRTYPVGIPLEIVGLDSDLVITNEVPAEVIVSLSAPKSLWQTLIDSPELIHADIDLTSLKEGTYDVSVNVKVDAKPVKVETIGPANQQVIVEPLYSKYLPIQLVQPSQPAIGYEAGEPVLSYSYATVSGPSSLISKITEIRAIVDVSQANQNIDLNIPLAAYDENGITVENVTIDPAQIHVNLPITQRGGYRNVTVKAIVTGQIASGYRLTNISVSPLTVTVYSADPTIVNSLQGYVETQPLNINGANGDRMESLPLNLPTGVSVVGESTIKISVTISPIQGSITLNNSTIELIGLNPEYSVVISPEIVDVILSGPLPILDDLNASDVRVILDLTDLQPGTYQLNPRVEIDKVDLLVESILPETIEVIISIPPTATPGN